MFDVVHDDMTSSLSVADATVTGTALLLAACSQVILDSL